MLTTISQLPLVEKLGTFLREHGVPVLLISLVALIGIRFVDRIIERLVRKIISRHSFVSEEEEKKREDTIIVILRKLARILIWFGALFFILQEVGVPIAPLLTGAGIFGVAIGFGAQSLVKDFITGLFIITENQYRIGDVICVGEYCGVVEDMTLRITKLRNIDGTIHYIPNSEIRIASNKSKDFSMVDFKIGVSYDTDLEHLEEVINDVGDSLKEDPRFGIYILEAPHFLRIDDFGESAIIVHISGKVYPKRQYLIGGEMKRRLKHAFDEHGIVIPYPTRVVYQKKFKGDKS